MKSLLLLAAFAAPLLVIPAGTSQANDLRFAISALKSARQTFTRPSPSLQQMTTSANPQSGEPAVEQLLLGAYVDDIDGGLQVTSTVPGSPASDVLRTGDVIRRISVLGQPTRKLETTLQFDYAKRHIGPNRPAALEIYRPGQGMEFVWVTFRPAGQLAQFSNTQPENARSMSNATPDNYVSR